MASPNRGQGQQGISSMHCKSLRVIGRYNDCVRNDEAQMIRNTTVAQVFSSPYGNALNKFNRIVWHNDQERVGLNQHAT
jgi:hypothetical protein